MSEEKSLVLMNAGHVRRSLKRIAHEIAERNSSNRPILLVGIKGRGYMVARELLNMLIPLFGSNVEAAQLTLEDATQPFEEVKGLKSKNPFLLVVDDVIFTGHTMFRALIKVSKIMELQDIYTAALIDRGHRKFPIKAEFCGMELPTKLNEHVSVIIKEKEIQKVLLIKYQNR